MRIDLIKLKAIEKTLRMANGGDYNVTLGALNLMIQSILTYRESNLSLAPSSVFIAMDTLRELEILVDGMAEKQEVEKQKPIQLNS